METNTVIVIAIVAAALVAIAWMVLRKRRSDQLRRHFGQEYVHTVREQHGNVRRAETELAKREQRVQRLEIRPLSATDRERYAHDWESVQRRFVDDPQGSVVEADRLVTDVMNTRGYPMGDFDQRAADISVQYPRLVENYRIAHQIVLRHNRGDVSTEDLRKAMVHYRSLFDELLETPERKEVA